MATPRVLGHFWLSLYRLWVRAWAKAFSVLASGGFASFGARSVLETPIRISGEERISVGSDVYIGAGSWLQVLKGENEVALFFGDGTGVAGSCVFSAASSIRIGSHVLIARGVYIADHSHAFDDISRPVLAQGITGVRPVEIGDGAWLGENVVIGPGVKVGRGAVVGANSVVLDDVPDFAVAVGAPARIVRLITNGESAS
jgi:acetyltransferase-like isoleucine patch superfamily enzyme